MYAYNWNQKQTLDSSSIYKEERRRLKFEK